jgi:PAS domain S-box-containing protein
MKTPAGSRPAHASTGPLISPVTDLPLASMRRRRLLNVSVFLVVGAVAAALGYVPWEVPFIVLAWVGSIWVAMRASERVAADRALNIETASYCFNATLLTFACYYLGGATWIAGTFYTLLVIVAGASLPRWRALLVAVVALAGFAFLALAPVIGMIELPPFGAAGQSATDLPYAILTVVVQGVALVLAVLLQQSLVGALRDALLGSRMLIEAATDLIAVVDRQGLIHRANPAFQAHTAVHSLYGTRLSDIATEDHQGYMELKLAQASNGTRVAFELSYRGTAGRLGWLGGTLVPLPAEGSAPRVLLIARDVTLEHEATAENVVALARLAAGLRTKTLAHAITDVMHELEVSLDDLRGHAIALRGESQLQANAAKADNIATEAERLREVALDTLEWLNATRERQAS